MHSDSHKKKWKKLLVGIAIIAAVACFILVFLYTNNHPGCSTFNSMGFTTQQQAAHFLSTCSTGQ
jgi:hypothetical protein